MLGLKRCEQMNSLVICWDVQGMGQTNANKGVPFKGARHVNMLNCLLLGVRTIWWFGAVYIMEEMYLIIRLHMLS